MTRECWTICRHCGGWHDKMQGWPQECRPHFHSSGQRSSLAAPMTISDHVDALQHPANGMFYDSKSKIREVAKAHNLIEVGTERQRDNRRNDACTNDEVGEAIQKLNQGYTPPPADSISEGWSDHI